MIDLGKFLHKNSEHEILPIQLDESRDVAELHSELFRRGWDESEFSTLLANDNVYGYFTRPVSDTSMSGFVISRVVADEAEILTIGTAKRQQRNGLGWRLMRAAIGEATARGAKKMFLEVDQTNQSALGLYQKIGFEHIGERKAYYTQDDASNTSALVLGLQLS